MSGPGVARTGARRGPAPAASRPAVGVLLALAVSCSAPPEAGPPAMHYGLDECSQCRMIVSEPRHAAALVTPAGDVERFDDIGCLLRYREERNLAQGTRFWVHDQDQAWRDVGDVLFVHEPGTATPMGYGHRAYFPPHPDLSAVSADRRLSWSRLTAEVERTGTVPSPPLPITPP